MARKIGLLKQEEIKMNEEEIKKLDREVGADWIPTSPMNSLAYCREIYKMLKELSNKK